MQNATLAARPRAADVAGSLVPQLEARERDHDRAGTLAVDNLRLIAEEGLLTINVPLEHGGFGEGLAGTVETLRVLAQGSPSTALMLAQHTNVLANYLSERTPAAQRAWAFGEAMRSRIFGVANSEAGTAGNVKSSKAEVRDGRLYGVKSFCSMGTHPDYYMAAARDAAGEVDYHVVANDPAHVRVETAWDAVGMRSSESVSLRFDGARVVAPLAAHNRHWSTLSFTAVFIGIAESLLDDVTSPKSGILQKTGAVDLHLTLQACRSFLRHCADSEPAVIDDAYRALVRDCKLFVTRTLAQQATAVYVSLGGSAYRFGSPVSRKLRDLLAGPALRPPVGIGFEEVWAELVSL